MWTPYCLPCDPYDNLDFAEVLDALARFGFVEKYEINGEAVGWISAFSKH
jgi:hypothetical protein